MNQKFTGRLIRAIKNRPILYLQSHPEHKNEGEKLEAWREIRKELNEDVPVLKAKWKNLKDSYKKHKLSKKNNCSKAVKKLHSWAWADHMRFIDFPDDTDTTLMKTEDPSDTVENTHKQSRQDTVGREESDITDSPAPKYRKRRPDKNPTLTQNKRTRFNNEKLEAKCDGVDLLFLGYADTFKKLSKRKQITVKFEIAKMLMEAEMSDLNDLRHGAGTPEYLESDAKFDDPLHATTTNIKEETMSVEQFD